MSAPDVKPGAGARAVPALAIVVAAALAATGTDVTVFRWLNGWSHATGPSMWPYVTILGDTAVALALVAPLAARRADIAWALAWSAVLATLFVHGVKPVLELPRPPAVLASDAITVIGPAYTARSFPSGHTTTIFLAAGLAWLHYPSRLVRGAVLVVAVSVGLSRAVVGVHWPIDIAGGAALGWLAALFGTAGARRFETGVSRPVHAVLATIPAACAVALLAGLKTGYPQALQLQYAIGAWGITGTLLAVFRKLSPSPAPAASASPRSNPSTESQA